MSDKIFKKLIELYQQFIRDLVELIDKKTMVLKIFGKYAEKIEKVLEEYKD